jgi:hypothetical protein
VCSNIHLRLGKLIQAIHDRSLMGHDYSLLKVLALVNIFLLIYMTSARFVETRKRNYDSS